MARMDNDDTTPADDADWRLGQRLVNHIRLTHPDFVASVLFYMEDVDFLDVLGFTLGNSVQKTMGKGSERLVYGWVSDE